MLSIKRLRDNGDGTKRQLPGRGPFLTDRMEEGRALTIELRPTFAILRPKGLRHGFTLTYEAMYTRAVELKLRDDRRKKAEERAAARKAKAKGRGK